MSRQTPVVNMSGDYEESITRLAKHLGKSDIRRRVFIEIYGRSKKPRSKKQIMAAANIDDKGSNSQQVQNALEYLSKHHLIAKHENNGQVKDSSRLIYGKEESVRANKDKIVRYADDPKLATRVPTKRHHGVQSVSPLKRVTRKALRAKKKLVVLYLVANPDETNPLRLDPEVRSVQESIRRSNFRDNIAVEYRPAADLQSLIDGLNDHRPQIIHFSGHGYDDGIATDSGSVDQTAVTDLSFGLLAKALDATDSPPDIIVLNSCESSGAKKALLSVTQILISMRASITDVAANAFAVQFYAAIASGQSVRAAFNQGAVAVEAVSIGEQDTPELHHSTKVDPATVVLT